MNMKASTLKGFRRIIIVGVTVFFTFIAFSCHRTKNVPSTEIISQIHLKRGKITLCGKSDKEFGKVDFQSSCTGKVEEDLDLAIELLHSFEYEEAEKAFAKVIDEEPGCAMAYWGVAMCNNHPLWTPPSEQELIKGAKAITIAQSITGKTKREAEYIDALALFYKDWNQVDHHRRSQLFEQAMEKTYRDNPEDKEAAIFYALALDAAADPSDQSYSNQKKAGSILFRLYPGQPEHPGIVHYIIHTYDYPGLANLALPAARKYATIAPSSAHAQHMPSHIFTRLGLWDDCIKANLASVSYARCYAPAAGIQGVWDEEMHGLDYLVYAYLQKGLNKQAQQQCKYVNTIGIVYPVNFKDAYAFAAIPSRYVLENKLWAEAAALQIHPNNFPWQKFPWQCAIIHFTRLLGFVHLNKIDSAEAEFNRLNELHSQLVEQKDAYKANQVKIEMISSEAWIQFKRGEKEKAIKTMNLGADMEDHTEKHPVTPCEVIPARELLGDMLLENDNPTEALIAYQTDLARHPNRFNGLYGAAVAAYKIKDSHSSKSYFRQLLAIADPKHSNRRELQVAKKLLQKKGNLFID